MVPAPSASTHFEFAQVDTHFLRFSTKFLRTHGLYLRHADHDAGKSQQKATPRSSFIMYSRRSSTFTFTSNHLSVPSRANFDLRIISSKPHLFQATRKGGHDDRGNLSSRQQGPPRAPHCNSARSRSSRLRHRFRRVRFRLLPRRRTSSRIEHSRRSRS